MKRLFLVLFTLILGSNTFAGGPIQDINFSEELSTILASQEYIDALQVARNALPDNSSVILVLNGVRIKKDNPFQPLVTINLEQDKVFIMPNDGLIGSRIDHGQLRGLLSRGRDSRLRISELSYIPPEKSDK